MIENKIMVPLGMLTQFQTLDKFSTYYVRTI
jgi:hypothetical protein